MAGLSQKAFLRFVENSRLLTEDQLAELSRLAEEHNDPRALAGAMVRAGLLTRWQAGQLLAGRAVFLGKYKLIDVLGRTGSESVFLAEHTAMNRRVALKILSKQVASDPARLDQFVAEARAAAALDHPNLVRALNIDNEGGRYYVVIEYVEGRDLEQTVQTDGPLDFQAAADVIRQAADGLAHAHRNGLVHGAIQPSCMLITRSGVVKVLGLGTGGLPRGDQTPGDASPEPPADRTDYAAPETHTVGAPVDPRADIYSLGCTLYYALTGRAPLARGAVEDRADADRPEALPDVASLRPDVPGELAEICRQMMAQDPGERIPSAEEVSRRLGEWQPPARHLKRAIALDEEEQTAAKEPSAGVSADRGGAARGDRRTAFGVRLKAVWSRLSRRQRIVVGASAGVLLLLLIAAGVWWMLPGSGQQRPDSAEPKQTAAVDGKTASAKPRRSEPSAEAEASGFRVIPPGDPNFDPTQFADVPVDAKAGGSQPAGAQTSSPERQPAGGKQAGSGDSSPMVASEEPGAGASGQESPDKTSAPDQADSEKPPQQQSTGQETSAATAEESPAGGQESSPQQPDADEPQGDPSSKPADPFSRLAEQLDLPECGGAAPEGDAGKAFRLGEIASADDADWQLILLGGDVAYRKNRAFVLEQTTFDAASARWTVRLETRLAGREPERSPVGEFSRRGKELLFEWADGADPSTANYLRNCLLQVRVSGKNRLVKLRTTVQAEPIALDLKRGVSNLSVPVKWLPDAEFLRVEIAGVEPQAEFQTEPQSPAAVQGPIDLQIPRKDRHGNTQVGVVFRITVVPRTTTLSVRTQLTQPPATAVRALATNFVMLRARLEPVRSSLERKLNPPNRDQAPRGTERSQILQQLEQLDERLWYVDFWEKFRDGGHVRFRLFVEAGDQRIVFVAS